jgi:hypothetical protein
LWVNRLSYEYDIVVAEVAKEPIHFRSGGGQKIHMDDRTFYPMDSFDAVVWLRFNDLPLHFCFIKNLKT